MHALEGWSGCLRLELAPFGIDVVIVQPGGIRTSFGEVLPAPMEERSGNTTDAERARKVESASKASCAPGGGSPPSGIAKVIAEAIRARKLKTRYAASNFAGPLMVVRQWFGNRIFDRAVTSAT